MQSNRSRDTTPEMAIRRQLHALGLRYRVCVRPVPELRRNVDIVFTRARVAVEVRGCFWHGCPQHYRLPGTNADYWESKIGRNVERDLRMDSALVERGWLVIVVWEHDDVAEAVSKIAAAVKERTGAIRFSAPGVLEKTQPTPAKRARVQRPFGAAPNTV